MAANLVRYRRRYVVIALMIVAIFHSTNRNDRRSVPKIVVFRCPQVVFTYSCRKRLLKLFRRSIVIKSHAIYLPLSQCLAMH